MDPIHIPFEYFYGNQTESFQFYRIPKALITHPYFSSLSNDAALLYGLFLDRAGLSAKNNWVDDAGRVFIIYTIESICKDMNCASAKAEKMMKELERYDLLYRKRRGQGNPSLLYPKTFFRNLPPAEDWEKFRLSKIENQEDPRLLISENLEFPKSKVLNDADQNPKFSNMESPDMRKSKTNDTEESKLNGINDRSDMNRMFHAYESLLKENLAYDETMASLSEWDAALYDEMFGIVLDVVCVPRDTVEIGSCRYPSELVRSKFLKLSRDHLLYVMERMKEQSSPVTNMHAYLLSALYHASSTMNHFYQNRVESDKYAPPDA